MEQTRGDFNGKKLTDDQARPERRGLLFELASEILILNMNLSKC